MRLSNYFLPLLKENPAEAKILSHRLMLRAGMIRQQNSGIYYWLPLGLKVLEKIKSIIKTGLEEEGCLEVLMPCIQPAELWKESGRYDSYGKEMLKIIDRHENDMLFGPTNEETITDIVRNNIFSYKDLPKNFYQIQWKFRDEIRPRFGVMRGREFLMKDGYSFDVDIKEAEATYKKMYITYLKIFKSLGLTAIPVRAVTGAIGGNLSHEFHIIAETGESEIFFDKEFNQLIAKNDFNFEKFQQLYAAADEMHEPAKCPIEGDRLINSRGIEVGHIFCFGDKYTKALGAKVMDKLGNYIYPQCGSYGIGVSRLVGAIIEASHDEKGIIWPDAVSPFHVSLINLKITDATCLKLSNEIYEYLTNQKIDVLYDDSDETTGTKFAVHDLLGFSWQIIVGPKSAAKNMVELKCRKTNHREELSVDSLLTKLASYVY